MHGQEALTKLIADWVEDFDDYTIAPQEFIDANDEQVIVRVRQAGVGKQSGVRIEEDFWFVHTLSAGKITRFDMLVSKAAAFETAELSE